MTGNDIRGRFLGFFQAQGHKLVPSSSLVPHGDPTLLFTNAGMNQFKGVFLGEERRDYVRATSAQKCVRAGGKHNDLETVGFSNRHHTFFEMLGNFSFGDYFKREAIALAWQLLTDRSAGYGLDRERLYATVFEQDDQAERIWRDDIGLAPARVVRMGEKDNFWAMGDTGPCGPCSEVHIDLGPEASERGHADCEFPCDCGRYVEIWNLVFMQFERAGGGHLRPLPRPSIDTGAGLERLTAVMQGKRSNFETDLFQPLIAAAGALAGVRYGEGERSDVSLRIIADHVRAATFLINDGVVPANEGRGYVLRKIIRRGLRHGRILGLEGAFLFRLAGTVADEMAGAYPDLNASRDRVAATLRGEEDRFSQTLALALKELDRAPLRLAGGETAEVAAATAGTQTSREHDRAVAARPRLAGAVAFRLYDTYGLPLDLLQEIANERGFTVDEAGFHAEMESQRRRARSSWKGGEQASAAGVWLELAGRGRTRFEGYEATFSRDCALVALVRDGAPLDTATQGDELEAVLDHTPFYAASGGQIGDRGFWSTGAGAVAEVLDTHAPVAGLIVHRIRVLAPLRVGEMVEAAVDEARRNATRRNHTATHLLHAALRQVLGEHVKQAGSVVEPQRLRFDFSHYAPVAPAQIGEIERLVNEEVLKNEPVTTEILPLEQALESGAMALFGEKYQERVRVVSVPDFSKELCGGTHCRRTGDIGLFKVTYESSVAAGVRRIEAVTGLGAWERLQQASERIERIGALLRAQEPALVESVERLIEDHRRVQHELEREKLLAAQSRAGQDFSGRRRMVDGVAVLATRADNLDRAQMRNLLDELRQKIGTGVVALGGASGERLALIVSVTADLAPRLPAARIIKALPGISGGGKAEMAEAGGKDAGQLDAILEAVYGAVAQLLPTAQ